MKTDNRTLQSMPQQENKMGGERFTITKRTYTEKNGKTILDTVTATVPQPVGATK